MCPTMDVIDEPNLVQKEIYLVRFDSYTYFGDRDKNYNAVNNYASLSKVEGGDSSLKKMTFISTGWWLGFI